MAEGRKVFKVGSRKSQLAQIQTDLVIKHLEKLHPDKEFKPVYMTTTGDQILHKPLPKIGEKSLFTKELEDALRKKEVDFVVHSLKDLPTDLELDLTIGAVLKREDPCDVLIVKDSLLENTTDENSSKKSISLKDLPKNSIIGTSSLRRTAQLARNYPDLIVENIRGNLNTRFRKLNEENYTGIILAAAGVIRLGWEDRISQRLDPEEFLYAVGQGALAVECRSGDDVILEILKPLNHTETILRVIAERRFLQVLGGGCSAPVAAYTTIKDSKLSITGAVWSLDGKKFRTKSLEVVIKYEDGEPPRKCPYREPKTYVGMTIRSIDKTHLDLAEKLGADLAVDLIKNDALDIINEAKTMNNEKPEEIKKELNASCSSSNNHSNNIEVK